MEYGMSFGAELTQEIFPPTSIQKAMLPCSFSLFLSVDHDVYESS
jgi:hypothetical protein